MLNNDLLKGNLYIGLVHYPIKGKDGNIVQTSITNLDVHDIARTACTYDLKGYYLIAPAKNQIELLNKIIMHWTNGYGSTYNSDRKEALKLVKVANTINDVKNEIEKTTNKKIITVVTDARKYNDVRNISCISLRNMLKLSELNVLLLFGTGWGLCETIIQTADYILEPIRSMEFHNYNHLSVRAAVAIIIDRIVGESKFIN